jgi:RimJ/RimL family protein N-acetyltransferase
LNRLEISAFAANQASNELAKKLGFKYEGTKREVSIPESTKQVHDDNIYSMLRREYKNEETVY